jgi:hypothetical protein
MMKRWQIEFDMTAAETTRRASLTVAGDTLRTKFTL